MKKYSFEICNVLGHFLDYSSLQHFYENTDYIAGMNHAKHLVEHTKQCLLSKLPNVAKASGCQLKF